MSPSEWSDAEKYIAARLDAAYDKLSALEKEVTSLRAKNAVFAMLIGFASSSFVAILAAYLSRQP